MNQHPNQQQQLLWQQWQQQWQQWQQQQSHQQLQSMPMSMCSTTPYTLLTHNGPALTTGPQYPHYVSSTVMLINGGVQHAIPTQAYSGRSSFALNTGTAAEIPGGGRMAEEDNFQTRWERWTPMQSITLDTVRKVRESYSMEDKPDLGIYDGTENYQFVKKFVKDAINRANLGEEVTLFICSPFYDAKIVGELFCDPSMESGKKRLKVVIFTRLVRASQKYLENQFESAVKALQEDQKLMFKELLENQSIEVYQSVFPNHFHCKWFAIVDGNSQHVDLLVGSANLTKQHLYTEAERREEVHEVKSRETKKLEVVPGIYKQLDSMERKEIDITTFQAMFLYPLAELCRENCSESLRLNLTAC